MFLVLLALVAIESAVHLSLCDHSPPFFHSKMSIEKAQGFLLEFNNLEDISTLIQKAL